MTDFNENNLTRGRFIKKVVNQYQENLKKLKEQKEEQYPININLFKNNERSLMNFFNDLRNVARNNENYIYSIKIRDKFYTINDDVLIRLRKIVSNGLEILDTV